MPTWLSDPSPTFYVLALAVALVAVGLWVRKRDRANLVRAVAVVGLVAGLALLDLAFESPREASVRTVNDISAALNDKKWDRFAANLSESFEFKGHNKAQFVDQVKGLVGGRSPRSTVWDVKPPEDQQPAGPDEFLLQFEARGDDAGSPAPGFVHIVGTFRRDPDGRWRLKTFSPYSYIEKRSKIDIPGL